MGPQQGSTGTGGWEVGGCARSAVLVTKLTTDCGIEPGVFFLFWWRILFLFFFLWWRIFFFLFLFWWRIFFLGLVGRNFCWIFGLFTSCNWIVVVTAGCCDKGNGENQRQ